ncbi:protein SSUH2 [Trichonephila inaurata madagascariensis]|uniref:Protein SSUH2 n=1 Tax=Trichonephila inaurata madagascariensis TaxID=2747483 RepID=A0A8X7C451_9ARAC|nr:protein SSUH2 [Trichonephila inaurata madagascariensis]
MDEKKMPGFGPPPPGIAVCPTPHDNDGYIPDEGVVMPPTAPPLDIPTQERMPLVDLGSLSDEDVRDACVQFASENCCYGKKFIRETALPQIYNGCSFHYQLETFGEKRETAERHEPYRGEYIDGPENGIPPAAWDIPVTIPAMFVPTIGKVEIPHTARVKECFRCVGNCRVRCESCYGRGGNTCWNCHGSGRRGTHSCSSCGGGGRQRCWNCSGSGQVKCGTCDGIGRLRHFMILIITW